MKVHGFLISFSLMFLLIPAGIPLHMCQAAGSSGGHDSVRIIPAAERMSLYLPMVRGKNVAVTANHSSRIAGTHLVDSLLSLGIQVKKVFSPEHGFRGDAADGQLIDHQTDPKTGLPIISLYGKKKKPEAEDLKDVEVILFDIQDVGVRFYTYISTMTYVMEAAAAAGIPVIVLDRPNPHGHYIDGPLLEPGLKSFVGLHPVPVVYGMTIGEYALMVNGEGWLENGIQCDLTVIPLDAYDHTMLYHLPVPPSPNLPNMQAVYLYPSLALFEGSIVSVGRGTDLPFQIFGHPLMASGTYLFTPRSIPGASLNPPLLGQECKGYNLKDFGAAQARNGGRIYLHWLLDSYRELGSQPSFFTPYFDKLAGSPSLRQAILAGHTEAEIRLSWQDGLKQFRMIRKKYLLYPDFQ